jgi:uncharacterized membrane protein
MNKLEYLAAVKNALTGIAPAVIDDMIHAYEMRFIEGANLGRSEQEIIQGLDSPEVIAARFQSNASNTSNTTSNAASTSASIKKAASASAFTSVFTSISGVKFFSFVGLSVFNFFLIVPTIVFCAMLFASYASSLGLVVGGSGFTAASLAKVNQVTLNQSKKGSSSGEAENEQAVVEISNDGVNISDDKVNPTRTTGIYFGSSNSPDQPSAWRGLGLIFGGILLFLLNLVITKYSFIGVKRYAMMNYSILKNA